VEYSQLDNEALYRLIDKAAISDRLKNSSEWKLVQEAADRIVERALSELCMRTRLDDIEKVRDLVCTIKKYKYQGIFSEIEWLSKEGEHLFEEMKYREELVK